MANGLAMPPGMAGYMPLPSDAMALSERPAPAGCAVLRSSFNAEGFSMAMQFDQASALGVNLRLFDNSIGQTQEVGRALIAFRYRFDTPRKTDACGQ